MYLCIKNKLFTKSNNKIVQIKADVLFETRKTVQIPVKL